MVPPLFSISANGGSSGIVWAYRTRGPHVGEGSAMYSGGDGEPYAAPGALYAFDATTLAPLWSSEPWLDGANVTHAAHPADGLPSVPRLQVPTISNGRVYAGTWSEELTVYGLGAPARPSSGLPVGAAVSVASDASGTWSFSTDVQGRIAYRLSPATDPYNATTGLLQSKVSGATLPLGVPGAPVAAAFAAGHISIFYVDVLGRVVHAYHNGTGAYWYADSFGIGFNGSDLAYDTVGLGGRGTAPPGSPVTAVAYGTSSLQTVQVGVIGHTGQPLHWSWAPGTYWAKAHDTAHDWMRNRIPTTYDPVNHVAVSPGFANLRTPISMVSRVWPNELEVYYANTNVEPCTFEGSTTACVGITGIYNSWWDGSWHPGPFEPAHGPDDSFPDRAPVTVNSRTNFNEDIFAVRGGEVMRKTWNGSTWSSLMQFSSSGMLPDRAVVSTQAVSSTHVNLLALDGTGQIKSEWSNGASAQWQFPLTAWASPITSAWQTFMGAGSSSSAVAMLANWPNSGDLDMHYVSASGQVCYRHFDPATGWGAVSCVALP
jgi:hypothetical protein